ncbi:hypothetical protein H072_1811 [Dactylellina haptotyla CBS 200.50]|uniref:J domain-containing protein n=1 Tax=Dactylellina haptotyla (strain CBS 200.50) TaxID=1284197 RepID=S8AMR9_DACHA|nr:hypothetical protein H072_1811 [Dactylellina haptotyla CBS 200.50]
MGAQQSTQDSGSQNNNNHSDGAMKQDFYTLLGVDRNADQDEIKKAYRRKALELHPDKNVNNVEAATKLFSEIQSAYEVLSDPQERAWYDSHREQILREDDDGDETIAAAARAENVTVTTAELLKQFSLFSSRMDMQDSNPKGFYATASKIFETIAREEEAAAARAEEDIPFYPAFGNSKSDYQENVRVFYTAWTGFSTMKSFAWEDKYRYRDAPDRRVRRLMEKENKKLRDTAIREFNDTVKQFVLYIRKRDPRYLPNFQSEKERDAVAREASQDQSRRARMENAAKLANYKEAEWSKTADIRDDSDEDDEDGDDAEPAVEFECVACNKTFKTEKQMEMHEKSKKHIKIVQTIKRQMRKDGIALHLDEDGHLPKGKSKRNKKAPKVEEEDEDEEQEYDSADLSGEEKPTESAEKIEEDESDTSLTKETQKINIEDEEEVLDVDDANGSSDKEASENETNPSQSKSKTKKARRKAKQSKTQQEVRENPLYYGGSIHC